MALAETTPRKFPEKQCCLCGRDCVKHLTNVGRKLLKDVHFSQELCDIVNKQLKKEDLIQLYICYLCVTKVKNYTNFKVDATKHLEKALQLLQHEKRVAKTPSSQERPKKITTVEWITKSVEKLRVTDKKTDTHTQAPARKRLLDYPVPTSEHSYAVPLLSVTSNENIIEQAKTAISMCPIQSDEDLDNDILGVSEFKDILAILQDNKTVCTSTLAFMILKCDALQKAIKQLILKDVAANLQTGFKPNSSSLFYKGPQQLMCSDLFSKILLEIKEKLPFLFDILTLCCHGKDDGARITMISTIFAMMMQSRNNKASAVQRLYASLCIRYHADNRLLSQLNSIHLTLTQESKADIIKDFGHHSVQAIISKVEAGRDGKINGDNLDIRVTTGDMRLSSRDKDFHFFASDWTPDRVDASGLPNDRPSSDPNNLTIERFLPSPSETLKFKEDMKLIIATDLAETFPCFSWMKLLLPKAIPHDLASDMAKQSTPCLMPVLLKNETKYSDCVGILQAYQEQAKDWYQKAGREEDFTALMIPIGGDQLTRVRLQGAKLLRAGAHTSEERFENLSPMVVELFHTIQDFLEKLCKKFLKLNKGREVGTLANLKVVIQRTNVNGQVKVRFKAHEDFIMTAGHAYLTELAMEHFGMENKDDSPTANKPPVNVEKFERPRRQAAFDDVMNTFVGKYITPFTSQDVMVEDRSSILLKVANSDTAVKAPVDMVTSTAALLLDIGMNKRVQLKIPLHMIQGGKEISVSLPGVQEPIRLKKVEEQPDDLYNYILNLLQWYFVLKNFKDAIKQGDTTRTNICLKVMIPFFYMHSKLSKYLVECLDYILKTEVLLSPQISLRVQAGSFVNRKGRPGKNKPADMEKENQVKFLKDLIRGLGKEKTESAIVNISKAGPVFLEVTSNYELMTGNRTISTKHKSKSSTEDHDALFQHLRRLRPLKLTPGRKLDSFHQIPANPFSTLNRKEFATCVMKTIERLKRNQHVDHELEDEDTDTCKD